MTLDKNQKALIAANRAIFSTKRERVKEMKAWLLHATLGAIVGGTVFVIFVAAI